MGRVAELYKLEDHIRDCDDRYNGVIQTIEKIDNRLDNIEKMLAELKVLFVKNQYMRNKLL